MIPVTKAESVTEVLDYLRALTDPTPDQLREASDLALLATGWACIDVEPDFGGAVGPTTVKQWTNPQGQTYTYGTIQPHPCASIDDAVRWMVPGGYLWDVLIDPEYVEVRYVKLGDHPDRQGKERAKTEALARTQAGLVARLEGEK